MVIFSTPVKQYLFNMQNSSKGEEVIYQEYLQWDFPKG